MTTQLWFHEQLNGYFSLGNLDPRVGYEQGKKAGTTFGFDVSIFIDDLDKFIADPNHKATCSGHYLGNLMPGNPAIGIGVFNFMSPGQGASRLMEHHHTFESGGKQYRFEGEKNISHAELTFDEIKALTTLYCKIYDDDGKVYAAGVLVFPTKDLAKLITSFHTQGSDPDLFAKFKFLKFFLHEEAWVILQAWRKPIAPDNRRRELAQDHAKIAKEYDVVIVGSGYGGGVAAARLSAWTNGAETKSICVLERGREWRAGDFPEEPSQLSEYLRGPAHPMGLIDYHHSDDIDVIVASGLGGTSLINANVMLEADASVFQQTHWPALPPLAAYYDRARLALHTAEDPQPPQKARVFRDAAALVKNSSRISLVPLAVTFGPERTMTTRTAEDLTQVSCNDCGGCATGCNLTSKNTVDMTYLAIAERNGAAIFASVEVRTIEKEPNGKYTLHCRDLRTHKDIKIGAKQVIVSAGVMGSFAILSRSNNERQLGISKALGERFSGNGDVLGFAYNNDATTYVTKGPTITSVAHFGDGEAKQENKFIIEEGGIPEALMLAVRDALPFAMPVFQRTTNSWSKRFWSFMRVVADWFGLQSRGALEHSLAFLAMGSEESAGKMRLVSDQVKIAWSGVHNQGFAKRMDDKMLEITGKLGGTYVRNPSPRSFLTSDMITVHPLGGCPMGTSEATGVVNGKGQVFGHIGGMYVADGSIIPTALGVNPALTIAAISEYIVEEIAREWTAGA